MLTAHRRHLEPAQRVIVHLNKEAYLAKIAREKQKAQAERGVEGGRGHKKEETLSLPIDEGFISTNEQFDTAQEIAEAALKAKPFYDEEAKGRQIRKPANSVPQKIAEQRETFISLGKKLPRLKQAEPPSLSPSRSTIRRRREGKKAA